MPIPVLSEADVVARLRESSLPGHDVNAFYSSHLGGIVTDHRMMLMHADDRGTQLGWSVFDTCNVEHGQIYALDFHIDRFFHSMALGKIEPPLSKAEVHEIVSSTVAAGIASAEVEPERAHGLVRFWASAGVGGTNNSAGPAPSGPVPAEIYCKVSYLRKFKETAAYEAFSYRPTTAEGGSKALTVTVPLKPKLLATMKSMNYMLNQLAKIEVEEAGCSLGVWVEDGLVQEETTGGLAFVGDDNVLVTPPMTRILSSRTILRAMELARLLVERGVIAGIRVAPVPLAQAREAAEMMTMSASFLQAIVEWDGQPVGDGKPGPVAAALEELLWLDMQGLAQEQLDGCSVPADPSVVANLEEAAAPELAGAQHVSPIPRL